MKHPQAPLATLHLSAAILEQMYHDVAERAPLEACGLLGGWIDGQEFHAARCWALTNALQSQVRYRLDPYEQLAVFQELEDASQDLVAAYHSHPAGPDHPSPTDIAEAYYPDIVTLILSGGTGRWDCRAYRIQDAQVHPVQIRVENLTGAQDVPGSHGSGGRSEGNSSGFAPIV